MSIKNENVSKNIYKISSFCDILNKVTRKLVLIIKSFVVYDLKVFTKEGEKGLSANATIATAYIVNKYIDRSIAYIEFNTLSGKLKIRSKKI